jgi:hypothetical protein
MHPLKYKGAYFKHPNSLGGCKNKRLKSYHLK